MITSPPSLQRPLGAPPPPPPPPPPPISKKYNVPPPSVPSILKNYNVPRSPPPSTSTRYNAPPPPPPPPPPAPSHSKKYEAPQLPPPEGSASGSSKSTTKPFQWTKSVAKQGSIWTDTRKQKQLRAPEIDISELESLFAAASTTRKVGSRAGAETRKPEKVQLVDLRRAYNCEIMLTKIHVPLPQIINAILALDSAALDSDQIENLIKFCPTREEMEILKNYKGDKQVLGKCEQFFMELMTVSRVEAKLRVFLFTSEYTNQANDLRQNLNTINESVKEVRESTKLYQIMQTVLTLGNALNQGTARGSATGFRLNSLLKLSDTRASNSKMTLMHYLCKVLAEKKPELLDFDKDLIHLEASAKINLKSVAEDMQSLSVGLEKVEKELTASLEDDVVYAGFVKETESFLHTAEAEVRTISSLYVEVGRNIDSLIQYFGENPRRTLFEEVTQILVVFTKKFKKACDENNKLENEAHKQNIHQETL